ncbi:MAG: hypothetical protein B7W98_02350 [Parcubacteria group bacterium 20-58-5]|nr:MAG: hypothetical protein B7W98_02350 [Parcubacteria group bacterium 20-58-5]OYV63544.1 MAG: hypothetical protein B7X03_01360 [Parcubacteria group bacterium 21-58-10]OYV83225.1 MAG: hypothetical protein B7W96_00280 [Parcubacteria group bacterium 37-58-5]
MKRLISLGMFGGVALPALILVTNAYIRLSTYAYTYQSIDAAPSAEVALIPGAAILADGKPAPIFTDRVNVAIALYQAGKVAKILVSGDNSTVSHNEVNPVRLYLLAKGIPDKDIFLDHAGFDTYSSMYRARAIFGVSSMLIATQSFHLPRALFIARALGIQAYGVNADSGHILPGNYLREVFSDEKALFDVVFHLKPKYLGDTIPITGDGTQYP